LRFNNLVFDTNDRASLQYSSMESLTIDEIELALFQKQASESDKAKYFRLARASFGLALDSFKAPRGWQEQAVSQQSFVRQQDAVTRRAVPVYSTKSHDDGSYHVGPLFLPRPFPSDEDDSSSSASSWESEITTTSSSESSVGNEATR
jgi:hypothetical protein